MTIEIGVERTSEDRRCQGIESDGSCEIARRYRQPAAVRR